MSDLGGAEILGPEEGAGGAPEELSEEAKQRFAAAAAAMKALQREERRSKKRDDRVARTIIQFLGNECYTHLFLLISRLVARDCPSIFILAILSLISEESQTVVQEYLKEAGQSADVVPPNLPLVKESTLDPRTNRALIEWITRMQMVLSIETQPILLHLLVDERNIDGTVLQLSTFVLQEFFQSPVGGKRRIPFESLHPLAAGILQTVFEPFMDDVARKALEKRNREDEDEIVTA